MLTICTGLPGSFKTCSTIDRVKQLAEAEGRPVFYSGIADLKLPWTPLGDISKQVESFIDPEDNSRKFRYTLPPNAIVVVDEAQRLFRPRGNGQPVPDYVAALETHRHEGIDMFFITQHPMLIDANVRRLTGRHYHSVRQFGMQKAVIHEWASVKESCDKSREDSIKHVYAGSPSIYGLYKSAEVHTHKRAIPFRIWFIIAAPFLCIAFGYFFYKRLTATPAQIVSTTKGAVSRAGESQGTSSGTVQRASTVLSTSEYLQQRIPRVFDIPESAPVFDAVAVVRSFPRLAACIRSNLQKCRCWSQQGTALPSISKETCEAFVSRGAFDPYYVPQVNAGSSASDGSQSATGRGDGGMAPMNSDAPPLGSRRIARAVAASGASQAPAPSLLPAERFSESQGPATRVRGGPWKAP